MNRAFLALFAAVLSIAGRCAAADATTPPEIVLGMSTALTGPAANLGNEMRTGVLAGLERANREGGVQGRPLRLVVLDDGYEPSRTAPNMRRLVENENVLAVIGNVGTPTAIAALPIAREEKMPFYAAFTGAGILRPESPERYVINYRASYLEEIGAMIDTLIDQAGLSIEDIAFFTQRDGYGDAGFAGGIAALQKHGLKFEQQVLHVRYDRNTLAVENAVASLLYAPHEPRAVIMVGAYAPSAKFIRLAHQSGLRVLFLNVSFVGSASLAAQLQELPARVVVTEVVPHPLDLQIPIVAEYQTDLWKLDPTQAPGCGSLEGYIAARILTQALSSAHGPLNRETIVDALEGLGEFDPGIGERLRLDAAHHQACHRVWLSAFKDGSFVDYPWSRLPELLSKESK